MSRRQRVVGMTARFAAPLLPSIVRAGISQIDTANVNVFLTALHPKDSQDAELIRSLGIAPLIHAEYRFSTRQGHYGITMESPDMMSDWSDMVRSHSLRTIALHGALDPVISSEAVEDFAAAHAHIDLRQQPDTAQLLFYRSPEVICAALEEVMPA